MATEKSLDGINKVILGRKITAGFVKLDKLPEGKQFVDGIFEKALDMPVQGRTRPGVILIDDNGEVLKVPLGESVKDDLSMLEKGAKYRFIYTGSVPSTKGNDTKKFEIFEIDAE